jgi:NDP-sugar pyrophosphorylase family protein
MASITEAIILADRAGTELAPLTNNRPVCMLPVGNKLLLQITLEELYCAGIRSATVISSCHHELVRETFGSGRRFGMSLTHLFTAQPTDTREAIDMAGLDQTYPAMVIRGDMLRPFGFLDEALKADAGSRGEQIYSSMGIALPQSPQAVHHSIAWEAICENNHFSACLVNSVPAFHDANMMALDGEVPGVCPPGRQAPDHMLVGSNSMVRSQRASQRTVAVGSNCLVEAATELGDHVVIGDNSIIDVTARLRRTVVLGNTYVGAGTVLEDSIVAGPLVLCGRTGQTRPEEALRCLAV